MQREIGKVFSLCIFFDIRLYFEIIRFGVLRVDCMYRLDFNIDHDTSPDRKKKKKKKKQGEIHLSKN